MTTALRSTVRVDFCGEVHDLDGSRAFTLGREGDLVIDDNPYLHRRFLRLELVDQLWWLSNLGSLLTATVADHDGLMQAWLAPGAQLPVVFPCTRVWFTAGPTTYELEITMEPGEATFNPAVEEVVSTEGTTVGRTSFTPDQRLLVLALAEPVLRRGDRGNGQIPSNVAAATRLGWTQTKFNRKLDNVCQKLVKHGVRGLHGDAQQLAANRRARLVEYAVAARLVTKEDLVVLDEHLWQVGESSPSTATAAADKVPAQDNARANR